MPSPVVIRRVIARGSQASGPAAPSSLTVTQGDTGPLLQWTDNSSNETGFKIYKDGVLIYTTAANATSYTPTVTSGVSYTYTVKATNANGDSAASNAVAFTWVAPIEDTFNRSSADLVGDTPDVYSNGNLWIQRSGGSQTLQCDTTVGGSSAGRCYPGTINQTPINLIDFGQGDMVVKGIGQFRSGGTGSREMRLYGRAESSQFTDYWFVQWSRAASDATAPSFILWEITAGVSTNRGSYGSAHTTGERTIIWTMSGNNHTVNYEGVDRITYSSANHTDHTYGGVFVYEQTTNTGETHWTLFRISKP